MSKKSSTFVAGMEKPVAPIRILLVESDANLAAVLRGYLRDKNYQADVATTADEAICLAQQNSDYAVAVVDMSLTRRSGFRVLRTLREMEVGWPIYALTGESTVEGIVDIYETGADDVIRKPIVPEILLCKLNAHVSREERIRASRATRFVVGGREFDSAAQTLDGEHLSGRESDLLLLLCRHQNELVDKHVILRQLWDKDTYFASRSLCVYINHLRNMLRDSDAQILSVKGKGYKLVISVSD